MNLPMGTSAMMKSLRINKKKALGSSQTMRSWRTLIECSGTWRVDLMMGMLAGQHGIRCMVLRHATPLYAAKTVSKAKKGHKPRPVKMKYGRPRDAASHCLS